MDIEVGQSVIHGTGVYALRAFRKGEAVLCWDTSKRVPIKSVADYRRSEGAYLHPYDADSLFVVQSPERYVNHSCENNTEVRDFTDVAVRDIAVGEEITSNYETDGAGLSFQCSCGSLNCRGTIGVRG